MDKKDSREILDYLKRIDESINGPADRGPGTGTKLPLSNRIDKLDERVSEVQLGLATLAANTKAGFDRVDQRFGEVDQRFDEVDKRLGEVDKRFDAMDKRFDRVDRSIESTREQIVDLVTRVHSELTGRIIDLEVPGPGGEGSGGRGSGGGVPLAS